MLVVDKGFHLCTDHNNLLFLFDPTTVVANLSQTTFRKVLRWTVRLSVYNYKCMHNPGSDNVWADIISRWVLPPVNRRVVSVPVQPSSSPDDIQWPTCENLLIA